MSEENQYRDAAPKDRDETGEPIAELQELEQDTSPLFLQKVRRRIQRRRSAAQLVSASWDLPKIVFVELMSMFVRILSASSARKGD